MRCVHAAIGVLAAATCSGLAAGPQTRPAALFSAVTFTNGDAIRARIVEIGRGQAKLALEIAPDQPLTIDLARIGVIEVPDANAAAVDGELVELADGTRLVGKSLRFEKNHLVFELREGGLLAVPLPRIQHYRKPDSTVPEEAAVNKCSIVTDNGDVLIGDPSVTPEGALAIKGTVNVTVTHKQVAGIYAPPPALPAEDANDAATKPADKLLSVVATSYGSVMAGTELAVANGELSITLPIGQRITVPMRSVLRMEPAQPQSLLSGTGLRNVLAWGPWSDRDQEYRWTIDALKEKLPAGWKIQEDLSTTFDRDFQRRLSGCRTLLIPEPENWGSDARTELAKDLKPLADRFLHAGGNIVICAAAEGPLAFFKEAGLIEATKSGQSNTDVATFTTPGKRLAGKIGNTFTVCNSTYFYRAAGKAESWADAAQGSAVVARRVGRGYVILIGMDYYNRSDAINQLLVNAVLAK